MDKVKNGGSPGHLANGYSSQGRSRRDEEEKKPFIITRIFNKITSSMENGFFMLGMLIGNHPFKSVLISAFVVGVFTIGVVKFEENTDSDALWVPADASVYEYKNWASANFPATFRTVSIIFVSNNMLTDSAVQAMNNLYKNGLALTTSTGKNFSEICFMAGSNCWVTSILELWSYDDSSITGASTSDILNQINSATLSPLYGNAYDVTTALGGITYSGGNVDTARAAKMTFYLKGDDSNKDESMDWETKMVNLVLGTTDSAVSDYYVLATRSFSDVASETISGDVQLLSAGYMIVIVYIIIILGRFNFVDFGLGITVCGIMVIGVSLGFSFGLSSAAGWQYTPLHSVLPFLLLGIGVDDLFVIMGAYKSLPVQYFDKPIHERMAMTLKHAGVSITVTSLTDICAFGIGATTVLPALRSFCVFCCLGILALYLLAATFFVGCIALNAKRRDAMRNAIICCYKHSTDYQPNNCSKTELFTKFLHKYYAPYLMRLPVKIMVMIVTAVLLGIGIWGFVILEQDYNPIWFLPTDSYPYKYDAISTEYFNSGARAAVYCKNIDYYSSKTQFDSLYTQLTSSSYISSGSTDSWFKSFTDWLSTATAASVTSLLDANKYPVGSVNFYNLLYQFVTTESTGLRHSNELVFSNNSGVLGVSASFIRYTHVVLTGSTNQINAMDNTMNLVADLFPNDNCFAYGRLYLRWYTNKVIQTELYRNLGLAALCVFVVCLVLIANLFTSLMVFSCVIFTLVNVGGMMHFWGLTIDTVTSIILILAIGLAVDYSAHIGHCFMTFAGDRNSRVRSTLVEMGGPVFSGAFSTFLAFILLAVSNSYVFTTFFKVFFLVVIYGVFHGLAYLPVLLSWIGPGAYLTAEREGSGARDVELKVTANGHASPHKSRTSLNGIENPAMYNQYNRPSSRPVPAPSIAYNNAPTDQQKPYIPPPDYSPVPVRRSSNMPKPQKYNYGRHQRYNEYQHYRTKDTHRYNDWYYNNYPHYSNYY